MIQWKSIAKDRSAREAGASRTVCQTYNTCLLNDRPLIALQLIILLMLSDQDDISEPTIQGRIQDFGKGWVRVTVKY